MNDDEVLDFVDLTKDKAIDVRNHIYTISSEIWVLKSIKISLIIQESGYFYKRSFFRALLSPTDSLTQSVTLFFQIISKPIKMDT